jgi:hypothetical protein
MMRALDTKTGLPWLDRKSWEKGFSDGSRGQVWWPGPESEPLSYTAGYEEAQGKAALPVDGRSLRFEQFDIKTGCISKVEPGGQDPRLNATDISLRPEVQRPSD